MEEELIINSPETENTTEKENESENPESDTSLLLRLEQQEQRLNEMCDHLNEIINEQKLQKRTQHIKSVMRMRGATDSYVINRVLRDNDISQYEDDASAVESLLKAYDTEYAECRGESGVPRANRNATHRQPSAADTYFKQKAKKEGW